MKKAILFGLLLAALPCYAQFGSNATRLRGRPITDAAPTDTYAIVWSASQGKFIYAAGGGGGSGTANPPNIGAK